MNKENDKQYFDELDEWLDEEEMLEKVNAEAAKRNITFLIREEM